MNNDYAYRAVRQVLMQCRGKANAMTLQTIADSTGTSRREVELTIEANLDRLPFPVVASGCGVYLPTTAEDLNRYLHNLHSRHRRMQVREATTRRKALASGWTEENGRFVKPPQAAQLELIA